MKSWCQQGQSVAASHVPSKAECSPTEEKYSQFHPLGCFPCYKQQTRYVANIFSLADYTPLILCAHSRARRKGGASLRVPGVVAGKRWNFYTLNSALL